MLNIDNLSKKNWTLSVPDDWAEEIKYPVSVSKLGDQLLFDTPYVTIQISMKDLKNKKVIQLIGKYQLKILSHPFLGETSIRIDCENNCLLLFPKEFARKVEWRLNCDQALEQIPPIKKKGWKKLFSSFKKQDSYPDISIIG